MSVRFEKTLSPCVISDVIAWHVVHGWVWNVKDPGGRYIGVFHVTLLTGDGGICHFDTVPGVRISPKAILEGFKKGIKLMEHFDLVMASIPAKNTSLIRVVERIGFRKTDAFFERSGEGRIELLKYINPQKCKLNIEESNSAAPEKS